MTQVLIIVESALSAAQVSGALRDAIAIAQRSEPETANVKVAAASELNAADATLNDCILCPLTLNLPERLLFPAQALYAACRDVVGLRNQLESWRYATGAGNFWLPIVLTAKGALYGEVIGTSKDAETATPAPELSYKQPIHLSDRQRQPLYALGQRLLRSLNAPPAVYLMQFGWQDGVICFDRLIPFPAAPAIASLNVQVPNLFACHWACLTGKPLLDLTIG